VGIITESLFKFGYRQTILNRMRTTKTWCQRAHHSVFWISQWCISYSRIKYEETKLFMC